MIKKTIKTIGVVIILILCFAILIYDNGALAEINGENVHTSDVDENIQRTKSIKEIGLDPQIPTEEEALKAMIIGHLLEEEFVKENITLTPEEESYIENYLPDLLASIEEDIAKGGLAKEDAEATLETLNQYMELENLTLEEYGEQLTTGLTFTYKRIRLTQNKYGGDSKALEADLEKRYQKLYKDNKK